MDFGRRVVYRINYQALFPFIAQFIPHLNQINTVFRKCMYVLLPGGSPVKAVTRFSDSASRIAIFLEVLCFYGYLHTAAGPVSGIGKLRKLRPPSVYIIDSNRYLRFRRIVVASGIQPAGIGSVAFHR